MVRSALFAVATAWALAASAASAGVLDQIRDTGLLRIGYRADAPPYSFESSIGEPAGYTVDLCRSIASEIKNQLKIQNLSVRYVKVTAENRFESVRDGKIDLLCGATTATLGRREIVDFSLPTFIDGSGVLLRTGGPSGFADLEGKKVGVRAGTTTEAALRNTVMKMSMTVETVTVADHRDGVAKLLGDEISAYFADRGILYYIAATSGAADKLVLPNEQFTYETYALALPKGDGEFRLAVDRALSRIYRSGAIATIFTSNFGINAKPTRELTALYRISGLPE